jgi:hypothetical protein
MKKALIFIDYDITIRHFIHSGVFSDFEKQYDVTYIFHADSTSKRQAIHVDVANLGLKRFRFLEVPRARLGAWYHLFIPSLLARHRGTKNYGPTLEQVRTNHTPKMLRAYRFLSFPLIRQVFIAFMKAKLGRHQPLEKLLDEEKPDIILHPSLLAGYFINDLTISTARRGIPFVVLMNSWDNPSNKAMSTGMPTKLVVWGPQTKLHAMQYLNLPEDRIEMFGAAQFEVYREPVTESREELARQFGVPSDKPILLFGGASKSLNETGHLQKLDAAIEAGVIPPCHIIYRPHPWRGRLVDGEISLYDANLKHVTLDPNMEEFYRSIVAQPRPELYLADYQVTRRLMHLIDALISPLSTILIEAVMHGKPALALFVDADPESAGSSLLEIVGRLVYFAEFIDSEGILSCDEIRQLPSLTARLMQMTKEPRMQDLLLAHADKYLVRGGPRYGERVVDLANRLTRKTMA